MSMSWFKVDAFKELTEKVQSVIPKLDKETLEKLTLTSPELLAERERIDQEERHKEQVKDMISMLPWETRDPERDILVEECKEAILKLSSDKLVFSGPFALPNPSVKLVEEDDESKPADGGNEADIDEDMEQPADETLQKLKTLEPLPRLLQEFDLNAHVGLIQKLLKEDPKLVHMQSSLSGGGEHERIFWKNYFFHCAWCRYEAGLSIDEIWNEPSPTFSATETSKGDEGDINEEEIITFDGQDNSISLEKAFPGEPATDADAPFHNQPRDKDSAPLGVASMSPPPVGMAYDDALAVNPSEAVDFEMVGQGVDTIPDEDVEAYELDELEAEIARELEES